MEIYLSAMPAHMATTTLRSSSRVGRPHTVVDNPTLSVSVTGASTAQEGQPLTAVPVANDADDTFTYQWQNSSDGQTWTNISNATSATYTPQETDEGKFIDVVVTSHDVGGTGTTTTSAVTSKVVDVPPTMAVPTIADSTNAGAFREGDVLTASTTVTTDDGGVGVNGNSAISYQWQRSANGLSGWSNIGSNSASYTLTQNDENNTCR